MKINIVVGRFQVDDLHDGHRYLLDIANKEGDKLVVLLGCTVVKLDKKDPLDFETRKVMIQSLYPEALVIPVWDNKSDKVWSDNLDQIIEELCWQMPPDEWHEAILYHSRDSFRSHYSGICKCKEIEALIEDNGTRLREEVRQMPPLNSKQYRQGIIKASGMGYPKVYAVVDMFVYNHETGKVLLGRRKDEKEWRLFGGFSDPTDQGFKYTAQRELKEECGLDIPIGNFETIDSFPVDDWRFRGREDKIITTLYWVDADSETADEAVGSDDIFEVKWFDIRDLFSLNENPNLSQYPGPLIVEEHIVLINAAYQHWLEIQHIYG
jgi:bifunctional NMN adenylyltransferase/nudix hydrolase